jgi:hypothetical protein
MKIALQKEEKTSEHHSLQPHHVGSENDHTVANQLDLQLPNKLELILNKIPTSVNSLGLKILVCKSSSPLYLIIKIVNIATLLPIHLLSLIFLIIYSKNAMTRPW